MNMHHITKSLFVGAAIAGIGMSSGRAEITFNEGFRESVKSIVRGAFKKKYEAFNAIFPGTLSDVQLREDTDIVCNALFDRNSGFAHFFTDVFYRHHQTLLDFWRLYKYPNKTLKAWLGRNVLSTGHETIYLPDDVTFNGNTKLHIRTALLSLIERIRQIDKTKVAALLEEGLIGKCGRNRKTEYYVYFYREVDSMSSEISALWYPYCLNCLSEDKKAHYEVAKMLDYYRLGDEFCKAFLVSIVKNYSRYLTIKGNLQNNSFTSDTYRMYTKFKEANESLRRVLLLERYPSKNGKSGGGILEFLHYYSPFEQDKIQEILGNMAKKLAEMESFTEFIETHPRYREFMKKIRYRRLMRIWADSDNR